MSISKVAQAAIDNARQQSTHGPKYGVGECLVRVRRCYGAPAIGDWDGDGAADAEDGWKRAKHKHPTSNPDGIPAGVPIWWSGGRRDYGHVAISLGNGRCISTDIKRTGYFDVVDVDLIRHRWGLQLLGWTEDINGLTVTTPAPKPPPERGRGVNIDHALNDLDKAKRHRLAKPGTARRRALDAATRALNSLPKIFPKGPSK